MIRPNKILVTGATGYIGGRLVPGLIKAGFDVRFLARHPEHLQVPKFPSAGNIPIHSPHSYRSRSAGLKK